MFYAKSGDIKIELNDENVFTICPNCGKEHMVDLIEVLQDEGASLYGTRVYCAECSARHLPMWERSQELEAIAARFPGTDITTVQNIVRSGLDRGLSFEACLVGARLALSMETGKEELFSLTDVAAALGCSKEEAKAEMERRGIQGANISTLPGLEWILGAANAGE